MRKTGATTRVFIALLIIGVMGMGVGPLLLTAQAQGKIPQKVLFEKEVELSDEKVHVKIRHVTFPVGFKTPEHTHKGPGPRYILKGTLEVSEGGVTGTYGAGEVFWETGIPMTAENVGGEEAEFIIIELLPVK